MRGGGGVMLYNSGVLEVTDLAKTRAPIFNMTGGSITGNTALNGGGVFWVVAALSEWPTNMWQWGGYDGTAIDTDASGAVVLSKPQPNSNQLNVRENALIRTNITSSASISGNTARAGTRVDDYLWGRHSGAAAAPVTPGVANPAAWRMDGSTINPAAPSGYRHAFNNHDIATWGLGTNPPDPSKPELVDPNEGKLSVHFNLKGGTSPASGQLTSQHVQKGERASQPDEPTRKNHVFEGWNWVQNEANPNPDWTAQRQWNFATDTVNHDVHLEAVWTRVADIKDVKVTLKRGRVVDVDAPYWVDYQVLNAGTDTRGNITVQLWPNGEEEPGDKISELKLTVTVPRGWTYSVQDSQSTVPFVPPSVVWRTAGAMPSVAIGTVSGDGKGEANKWTHSWFDDNQKLVITIPDPLDNFDWEAIESTHPGGWKHTRARDSSTGNITLSYVIDESNIDKDPPVQTYYVVTHELDGGDWGYYDMFVEHVPRGDYAADAPDPKRNGYEFMGWQSGGNRFVHNKWPIYSDTTVLATWEVASAVTMLEVKYDANGGSFANGDTVFMQDVKKGTPTEKPASSPSREDHAFIGWYEKGATEPFDFDNPIDKSVTLEARWEKSESDKRWEIEIDLGGGNWVNPEDKPSTDIKDGTTMPRPPDPEREDFEFETWVDEDGNEFDFDTPIKDDTKIIAKWKPRHQAVTVTFVMNGGDWPDGSGITARTVRLRQGETVPAQYNEHIPERASYVFVGWKVENEDHKQADWKAFDFEAAVLHNTMVHATWVHEDELLVYVTYDPAGGAWLTRSGGAFFRQSYKPGSKAVAPAQPERSGHAFVAWQLGSVNYNFELDVLEDITLVATWSRVVDATPGPEEPDVTPTPSEDPDDKDEKEVDEDDKKDEPTPTPSATPTPTPSPTPTATPSPSPRPIPTPDPDDTGSETVDNNNNNNNGGGGGEIGNGGGGDDGGSPQYSAPPRGTENNTDDTGSAQYVRPGGNDRGGDDGGSPTVVRVVEQPESLPSQEAVIEPVVETQPEAAPEVVPEPAPELVVETVPIGDMPEQAAAVVPVDHSVVDNGDGSYTVYDAGGKQAGTVAVDQNGDWVYIADGQIPLAAAFANAVRNPFNWLWLLLLLPLLVFLRRQKITLVYGYDKELEPFVYHQRYNTKLAIPEKFERLGYVVDELFCTEDYRPETQWDMNQRVRKNLVLYATWTSDPKYSFMGDNVPFFGATAPAVGGGGGGGGK
jgi:hypothetical protein